MGKKINALLGGVVAAVSLGAAVALNAPKMAVETRADNVDRTVYCAIDVTTLSSYTLKLNVQVGNNDWTSCIMTDLNDTTTFTGKKVFMGIFTEKYGGVDTMQFQLYDGSTWKAQDQVISNWTTFGNYSDKLHIYGGSANSWQSYTPSATMHTVTKKAVVDGELEAGEISSSSVMEGTSYAVPDDETRTGYHFGGWYTTQACDVAFEGTTINADLTIYAKFTTLVVDSYIYLVTNNENDYVYFWGEYSPWEWEDKKASTFDVHGVLQFESNDSYICKVPVPSKLSHTYVLFHDGNEHQTGDVEIEQGAAYWFYNDNGTYKASHDLNAGKAIDFLLKVESERNASSIDEYNYSICGVAPEKAAALWNEYYALDADIKNYVNNSKTKTYLADSKEKGTQDEGLVSYEDIMNQLLVIAIKGGQDVQGGTSSAHTQPVTFDNATKNNITLVIIILSVAAITALGAYLFIDKKRSHK